MKRPKMGRPSKGPARRRVIVFRPPDLWTRLQRAARDTGLDVSTLLCRLAETYLRRHRGTRP